MFGIREIQASKGFDETTQKVGSANHIGRIEGNALQTNPSGTHSTATQLDDRWRKAMAGGCD